MIHFRKLCSVAAFMLQFVLTVPHPVFAAGKKALPAANSSTSDSARTASAPGLRVPVIGYVTRHSPVRLLPILGIPSAAAIGEPIALPEGIANLSVSPSREYGIALVGDAREIRVLPIGPNGAGELTPVAGVAASADRVDFSPTGSVVALYSRNRQIVQVVAGLPLSPHVVREVDASIPWGEVTAVAVSDDGQSLLLGYSDGDIGAISLLTADGQARTLANAGKPSAIRFSRQNNTAVAADSKRNEVLLLSDVGGASTLTSLANETQGTSTPLDVEFSADQRYAYVANSGANSVLSVEIASGALTTVPCAFAPSGLKLVGADPGLLISFPQDETTWLIDTSQSNSGAAYIPNIGNSQDKVAIE